MNYRHNNENGDINSLNILKYCSKTLLNSFYTSKTFKRHIYNHKDIIKHR